MDDKEPLLALTSSGDRAEGTACSRSDGALLRQSFDRWLDREIRLLGGLLGAGSDERLVSLIRRHRNLGQGD